MRQKRKFGIRSKLILVIIPIVFVLIICFFTLSRNMIVKQAKKNMVSESKAYTEKIHAWAGNILSELQVYKDTIEEGGFKSNKKILKYLKTSCGKNEAYPIGLYLGDDSGVYLDGSGWVPDDDWVLVERDWYIEGKDHEKFAFGEPYYDSQSGQVCVSASVRMNYKKAVRVLSTDVYLDYLAGLMKEIKVGDTGKAFMVTGSQTVIAHSEPDMMDKKLTDNALDTLYQGISKNFSGGKTGLKTVKGSDGEYYVNINGIEGTDWYLVTYIREKDVLSDLRRLENKMIIIAVIAAVILIFASLHIMNKVVRPVQNVTNVLTGIASGDFSQDIEVNGNDEIAQMGHNMQMFLHQMRDTISDISNTAQWLNKQSEDNEQVSGTLMDSSRNQASAMEELSEMVEQLSSAAEQAASQMDILSKVVRSTRQEGEQASEMMKQTVAASESGQNALRNIKEGMNRIEETIGSLAEQIRQTGESTGKISDMVNMIMEIAEETNLLSLNASIEAARAGEAGKGFAVVAEQISRLAANSGTAADDISKVTEDIRQTVERASTHMNRSVEEVRDSIGMIEGAGKTFESVFEKVDESDQMLMRMVALVNQVNDVAAAMESISETQLHAAEQMTASTERLGGYTQVVTDNSDNVAENAKELGRESKVLMERMSHFQV